jgi:hypothetical protein
MPRAMSPRLKLHLGGSATSQTASKAEANLKSSYRTLDLTVHPVRQTKSVLPSAPSCTDVWERLSALGASDMASRVTHQVNLAAGMPGIVYVASLARLAGRRLPCPLKR